MATAITCIACIFSRSKIIRFSGIVVAIGWLVSAAIYLVFRSGAGPVLAFQMSLMGLLFFYVWKNAKPKNKPLFRIMFWLHFFYFVAGAYRMFGEWFFPGALAATYSFYQTIGNGIYILTLAFLFSASLRRIHNDWPHWKSMFARHRRSERTTYTDTHNGFIDRLVKNLFIEVSNSDKPDDEHIPLETPAPSDEKGLQRQPVSRK